MVFYSTDIEMLMSGWTILYVDIFMVPGTRCRDARPIASAAGLFNLGRLEVGDGNFLSTSVPNSSFCVQPL
jgi:hypothetical protein